MPEPLAIVHALFWISVVISVVGMLTLPIVLVWIPADYFVRPPNGPISGRLSPGVRIIFHIVRNMVALVFFLLGMVMLVTPGQGVLMLLASLWLANFPGKHRLERRLVSLPGVRRVINKIRTKAGVPPLEVATERN